MFCDHCKVNDATVHVSDRVYLSNALHTADGQYLLKATGWGRIVANRDTQSHDLMIDGRRISGADFMDLLTLHERITEYEALCRHGDRETAKRVGRAMIRRLKAIDHQSDTFPESNVARIRKALPEFTIEDDEEIGQDLDQ